MLVDTEIGKVNRDWQETTLGSVVDSVIDNRGKTPPLSTQGIKLIETGNVSRSSKYPVLFLDNQKLVDMSTYLNWFRSGHPSPDDILFTTVGEAIPQFCLMGKGEGAIAQNLIALNFVRMKVEPEFMLNYFRQNRFIQQCKNIMLTTAQPSLKVPHLLSLTIFLPPLQEQKAIASVLSSFDDKIELLRKQNQTLEKIAQTLFKHWFVDFNFPDENGHPYKDSGGKMVASELGEIPEGWEVDELGNCIQVLGGGTPKTNIASYWEPGEIPWYSPTDLTKNCSRFSITSSKKISELGLKKSSAKLFPSHSVMMTSRATIGTICINLKPSCTNQGFITLLESHLYKYHYLYLWLRQNMSSIEQIAQGTTFLEVSKTNFKILPFLKPNIRTIKHFNEVMDTVFPKIEIGIKEIVSLQKSRDLLLPKLISGEIRVKDIPSEMEAV